MTSSYGKLPEDDSSASLFMYNEDNEVGASTTPSPDNGEEEELDEERVEAVRRKMILLTSMAATGGFLFGYDTGIVSGAMLPIGRVFGLNAEEKEWVVSCTVLAAFGSSLLGGNKLNTWLGRKGAILVASFTFALGALILAAAWNYAVLIVGRVVLGIAIGITSVTTPMYLAEVAASDVRGKLVTINGLMVCFGQFIAGIISGILDSLFPDQGWRVMMGLAAIPAIVMFVGFYCYLPESPRWLVMDHQHSQAQSVLDSIRKSSRQAQQEYQEIVISLSISSTLTHHNDNNDDHQNTIHENPTVKMLQHAPTRRALILGCGLMLLQQFAGINTVMYYAASIYQSAGFKEKIAVWLSAITASGQVIGSIVSIYLIDSWGRRTLVLWSLAFVTISLVSLGLSFYLARVNSSPVLTTDGQCHSQTALVWSGITEYCYDCVRISGCGYCPSTHACLVGNTNGPSSPSQCTGGDWKYHHCGNPYGFLSVLSMIAYLIAFGIGMGPLPWTIHSEIYPLEYRARAISVSTATNWIGNFIISVTFLTISSPKALTQYGAFFMYSIIAFLGWIWLYFVLPETKGLHLEEVENLFRRPGDPEPDSENETTLTIEQKQLLAQQIATPSGH